MVVDVLVVIGAVGIAGFLAWFFFGSRAATEARVTSGVQEATVVVQGGYSQCMQGFGMNLALTSGYSPSR